MMEIETVKGMMKDYRYALIYKFDGIILDETKNVNTSDFYDCLEARFFDEGKELRVWRESGEFKSAAVSFDGDHIDVSYELDKRFSNMGNTVIVRQYLGLDDDGQTYIKSSTVAGFGR